MTGLRGARNAVVDVSLGGLRMYSDEPVDVGSGLELDLVLPGSEALEVLARVVWVDALPPDAPARYDVGLAFAELPEGASERIAALLAYGAK